MIDITSDDFTPMERRIFKSIVFEGLDIKALADKYCIQRNTVKTHLNAISYKLQITGNNRVFQVSNKFWREFMAETKWNCSICQFNNGRCMNPESQFFRENLNKKDRAKNMICPRFKEKKNVELH